MTRAVEDVLEEIDAGELAAHARPQQGRHPRRRAPPRAQLPPPGRRARLRRRPARAWRSCSERIVAEFEKTLKDIELLVPFSEGGLLSELHDVAGEMEREDTAEGVRVTARIPTVVAERYGRYAVNGTRVPPAAGGAEAGPRRRRRRRGAPRRRRGPASANGTSSSCAIRSPASAENSSAPRLTRITRSSPR